MGAAKDIAVADHNHDRYPEPAAHTHSATASTSSGPASATGPPRLWRHREEAHRRRPRHGLPPRGLRHPARPGCLLPALRSEQHDRRAGSSGRLDVMAGSRPVRRRRGVGGRVRLGPRGTRSAESRNGLSYPIGMTAVRMALPDPGTVVEAPNWRPHFWRRSGTNWSRWATRS
jgi:hypothetical protein